MGEEFIRQALTSGRRFLPSMPRLIVEVIPLFGLALR